MLSTLKTTAAAIALGLFCLSAQAQSIEDLQHNYEQLDEELKIALDAAKDAMEELAAHDPEVYAEEFAEMRTSWPEMRSSALIGCDIFFEMGGRTVETFTKAIWCKQGLVRDLSYSYDMIMEHIDAIKADQS